MIQLGVDKPPQQYARADEHRAQIARYVGRVGEELESSWKVVYAGSITTTASQASTTQAAEGATAGDAVFLFPSDATAAAMVASVYATVTASGILMNHPSQPSTGVFHAMVVAL